jgi:signal transduction histidine kinase
MGFSERLIKKELDKHKQLSYLKNIYTQAQNIESVVVDFDEYLSLSIDAGVLSKNTEVSFLSELLWEEYADICTEQGVALFVDNACAKGVYVNIDIAKMRRVFANLIGNAIRHNAKSGLEIWVSFMQTKENITITITDNGVGVPEEELPHIFELFFTSDLGRKVYGLGLPICDQIISKHGGTIKGENGERGFTATISLPQSK